MSTAIKTDSLPSRAKGVIGQLIVDAVNAGETDPREIAQEVVRQAPRDAIDEYLVSYVSRHALRIVNDRRRQAERAAFGDPVDILPKSEERPNGKGKRVTLPRLTRLPKETVAEDLKQMLGQSFALPDGRRVRWDDATPEDHRLRAAMLRSHANATYFAATKHEQAAALLVNSGAKCLAEVVDR